MQRVRGFTRVLSAAAFHPPRVWGPLEQSGPARPAGYRSSLPAPSSGPDGKIGASPDELADLFGSAVVKEGRIVDDGRPTRLLTTRREALSLYRECLRYSNLFVWRDAQGRRWRDVLRASMRSEFEAARGERDPALINRLIITGRDAVGRTVEGFKAKRAAIIQQEEEAQQQQQQQRGPSWGREQ